MISHKSNLFRLAAMIFCGSLVFSCQKLDQPGLGDYPKDPVNPGGTLKFYTAFEGGNVDSIKANFASSANVTYETGINGKAMRGGAGKFISYGSANEFAKSTSFTVSLWINTAKHTGGAQNVFMLPRTDDFWGNMFMLIEGNGNAADNTMQIKFHFAGQWLDYNGAYRFPDMYGKWRHIAWTYDETTSKLLTYLDGQLLNLPASYTDRKNGANPLGPAIFRNPSKFIIGGFQQHLGSPWGNPDGWMLHYTGLLDQFRLYSKALTAAEVKALFDTKQ